MLAMKIVMFTNWKTDVVACSEVASICRGPACGMMPSAALRCLRAGVRLSLNLPKIRQCSLLLSLIAIQSHGASSKLNLIERVN
jgi:hypothetical protein